MDTPSSLAFGVNGWLFVTDLGNHRVQVFTTAGEFIGGWGGPGSAPGQFQFPHSLVADAGGFVYVADTDNHRIQKFSIDPASASSRVRERGQDFVPLKTTGP